MAGAGTLTTNASDSYVAWGMALVSGTESTVEIALPTAGTLTNLQVSLDTAPGISSSWTFTVDKNGSATALTCAIAGVATSCSDSSLVPVVVGNTIDLHVTPVSSPALAQLTWSARITP